MDYNVSRKIIDYISNNLKKYLVFGAIMGSFALIKNCDSIGNVYKKFCDQTLLTKKTVIKPKNMTQRINEFKQKDIENLEERILK